MYFSGEDTLGGDNNARQQTNGICESSFSMNGRDFSLIISVSATAPLDFFLEIILVFVVGSITFQYQAMIMGKL